MQVKMKQSTCSTSVIIARASIKYKRNIVFYEEQYNFYIAREQPTANEQFS